MDKSSPKVSVFMPTYNHKKFISEAIDSILIQNYTNIEIIVGDDGSTDGTQEILKKYKKKYPHLIKLILSESNTGITQNCNRILKKCTGEYIALFSGDDVWMPNKLKKQIIWFKENPDAVLCCTKAEVFDSVTGETLYIAPLEPLNKIFEKDIIILSYALGANGCSFLIKKESIPVNGFDEKITMVSDWLFWVEVLSKGTAGYIDEILTKYRKHSNSASNNLKMRYLQQLLSLDIMRTKFPDYLNSIDRIEGFFYNELCKLYFIQTDFDLNCLKELTSLAPIFIKKMRFANILKIFCIGFVHRVRNKLNSLT